MFKFFDHVHKKKIFITRIILSRMLTRCDDMVYLKLLHNKIVSSAFFFFFNNTLNYSYSCLLKLFMFSRNDINTLFSTYYSWMNLMRVTHKMDASCLAGLKKIHPTTGYQKSVPKSIFLGISFYITIQFGRIPI